MLDIFTLYFANAAILLAASLTAFLSWYSNREQPGLLEWAIAMLSGGVGILLLLAFEPDPVLVPSILGNSLVTCGFMIGWEAMRRFNGRASATRRVLLLAGGFVVVFAATWSHGAGLREKLVVRTLIMAVFAALSAWEVLAERRPDGLASGRRVLAVVYVVIVIDLLTRAATAALAVSDRPADVFPGAGEEETAFVTTIALIALGLGGLSHLAAERLQMRYRSLALTDALTGLPNRRSLLDAGKRLTQRVPVEGDTRPVGCALMLDVDNFHELNERYGHPGGDRVLQVLADLLREELRASDHVCRYGGEEFCALLPHTDLADAAEVAERIRAAAAAAAVDTDDDIAAFTVSIGVATLEAGDLRGAITRADAALYRAKQHGRNRVEVDDGTIAS